MMKLINDDFAESSVKHERSLSLSESHNEQLCYGAQAHNAARLVVHNIELPH